MTNAPIYSFYAMKKVSLYILLFFCVVFSSCKKDKDNDFVLKSLETDKEVFVIKDENYPSDLVSEVQGGVYIQVQTDRRQVVHLGADPVYNFNASVITTENSPTVQISSGASNHQFTLGNTGASPGYKVYNSLNSGTNPTFLASYFNKNISIEFMGDSPIGNSFKVLSVYVPNPIMVSSPEEYQSLDSSLVTDSDMLTWVPDPEYKNAVLVRVNNFGDSNITNFLTPDDGALAFSSFSDYLNAGAIEIEIARLEYKTMTFDSRTYRVIGLTTSYSRYKLQK